MEPDLSPRGSPGGMGEAGQGHSEATKGPVDGNVSPEPEGLRVTWLSLCPA